MVNRQQNIKDFVRHNLGCACSDRVFDSIEERPVSPSNSPHNRSIVIGNKLLVNIWYLKETGNFREKLTAMLAAGRMARDAWGLNRFRAVVAVEKDLQKIAAEADACLQEFPGRDDRVHVHVVPAADIRDI